MTAGGWWPVAGGVAKAEHKGFSMSNVVLDGEGSLLVSIPQGA